jgi:hypothetical protein
MKEIVNMKNSFALLLGLLLSASGRAEQTEADGLARFSWFATRR